MIYCSNCGQQNDDAASACLRCGTRFTGQDSSTPFTTDAYRGAAQQPQQPGAQYSGPQGSAGAQPPQYMQQTPGAGGLAFVGVKRDPVLVLVFTLLTCGIYALWWYHTYATEVKNSLNRQDLSPGRDLLLSFVTCGIWGIIAFYYNYPKLFVEMQQRVGLPPNDISGTTILLGILFAPVSIYMIQTELNKIWDAAGGRR